MGSVDLISAIADGKVDVYVGGKCVFSAAPGADRDEAFEKIPSILELHQFPDSGDFDTNLIHCSEAYARRSSSFLNRDQTEIARVKPLAVKARLYKNDSGYFFETDHKGLILESNNADLNNTRNNDAEMRASYQLINKKWKLCALQQNTDWLKFSSKDDEGTAPSERQHTYDSVYKDIKRSADAERYPKDDTIAARPGSDNALLSNQRTVTAGDHGIYIWQARNEKRIVYATPTVLVQPVLSSEQSLSQRVYSEEDFTNIDTLQLETQWSINLNAPQPKWKLRQSDVGEIQQQLPQNVPSITSITVEITDPGANSIPIIDRFLNSRSKLFITTENGKEESSTLDTDERLRLLQAFLESENSCGLSDWIPKLLDNAYILPNQRHPVPNGIGHYEEKEFLPEIIDQKLTLTRQGYEDKWFLTIERNGVRYVEQNALASNNSLSKEYINANASITYELFNDKPPHLCKVTQNNAWLSLRSRQNAVTTNKLQGKTGELRKFEEISNALKANANKILTPLDKLVNQVELSADNPNNRIELIVTNNFIWQENQNIQCTEIGIFSQKEAREAYLFLETLRQEVFGYIVEHEGEVKASLLIPARNMLATIEEYQEKIKSNDNSNAKKTVQEFFSILKAEIQSANLDTMFGSELGNSLNNSAKKALKSTAHIAAAFHQATPTPAAVDFARLIKNLENAIAYYETKNINSWYAIFFGKTKTSKRRAEQKNALKELVRNNSQSSSTLEIQTAMIHKLGEAVDTIREDQKASSFFSKLGKRSLLDMQVTAAAQAAGLDIENEVGVAAAKRLRASSSS